MPEEALENNDSSDQGSSDQPELNRERIKHLLIGSPKSVKRTIHSLHALGYAEVREFSKPISAGVLGENGQVVSVLIRQIQVE